jgi:hypothetical protein
MDRQRPPLRGVGFEAQIDDPIDSGTHRRGHADGVLLVGSPETIGAVGCRIDAI